MCQVAKQRLQNYSKLKAQTEAYTERIARMKASEYYPEINLGNESQRTPGSGDRLVNGILRRLTYEDEMADIIDRNLTEMEQVRRAIYSLRDTMEQDVLIARYIDVDGYRLPGWRAIAIKIYHGDDDHLVRSVCRIHGRALKNIRFKEGETKP